VIMFQPPSSSNVFIAISTTGLIAGNTYNFRIYTLGDTRGNCAAIAAGGPYLVRILVPTIFHALKRLCFPFFSAVNYFKPFIFDLFLFWLLNNT
jgi:hypothetical protein